MDPCTPGSRHRHQKSRPNGARCIRQLPVRCFGCVICGVLGAAARRLLTFVFVFVVEDRKRGLQEVLLHFKDRSKLFGRLQ